MAFKRENLTIYSNNVKKGVVPAIYSYWNEAADTITGAGFFVDDRLAVGDQINSIDGDYGNNTFYNVSAVTSGAATVVANS